jgi:hypothetical protein
MSSIFFLDSLSSVTETNICLLLQLKRAHSAEPDSASSPRKSPSAGVSTPPEAPAAGSSGLAPLGSGVAGIFGKSLADESNANLVGSPLKKARPSLGADAGVIGGGGGGSGEIGGVGGAGRFTPALGDVLAKAQAAQAGQDQDGASAAPGVKMEEEEEL